MTRVTRAIVVAMSTVSTMTALADEAPRHAASVTSASTCSPIDLAALRILVDHMRVQRQATEEAAARALAQLQERVAELERAHAADRGLGTLR